jgi:hypothetical protein
MLKRYSIALKRLNVQLGEIANKYERAKLWFWLDALYCYLFLGASPRNYVNFGFYKLKNLERTRYVTMRRSRKIERRFNDPEYASKFNNKHEFNLVFSEFISRKWIYAPNADKKEIMDFLNAVDKVVIKPTALSAGEGIYVLESTKIEGVNAFCKELKERAYLIEEFITQHPEIARLNPSTVNTVRIYTLIDNQGKCKIIFAALRVGGANSFVDNFHGGGVGYVIDLDSGVIKQPGVDIAGNEYICHPSSGVLMVGFRIPEWERLKDFVLRAAAVFPRSRYIGWDVAVTPNGFEMVEGNYMADPNFLQSLDKVGKYKVFKEAMGT